MLPTRCAFVSCAALLVMQRDRALEETERHPVHREVPPKNAFSSTSPLNLTLL